jgi:hypothetical protein
VLGGKSGSQDPEFRIQNETQKYPTSSSANPLSPERSSGGRRRPGGGIPCDNVFAEDVERHLNYPVNSGQCVIHDADNWMSDALVAADVPAAAFQATMRSPRTSNATLIFL